MHFHTDRQLRCVKGEGQEPQLEGEERKDSSPRFWHIPHDKLGDGTEEGAPRFVRFISHLPTPAPTWRATSTSITLECTAATTRKVLLKLSHLDAAILCFIYRKRLQGGEGGEAGELTSTRRSNALSFGLRRSTSLTLHQDYHIVSNPENALISRACLETEEASAYVTNQLQPNCKFSEIQLCDDARQLMSMPNAGGSSINSEALSVELLHILYSAQLEATEMELKYWPENSKITDYCARINGELYGVSVTRAMKYKGGPFTRSDAEHLLTKKLFGVVCSTNAVMKPHKWRKQILHIWAETEQTAAMLRQVYLEEIPDNLKDNTLVLVTVAEDARWIFYNREH